MKKVYLTFDIETVVSGFSRNDNHLVGVYLGAIFIAEELAKRGLKATFFISLSSKQRTVSNEEYSLTISSLLHTLKTFENIRVAAHIHAFQLPVSFATSHDEFNEYTEDQQVELLVYSKEAFARLGFEVDAFRPGGFQVNESYYRALVRAGFKYSSILHRHVAPAFDLATGQVTRHDPYPAAAGVLEYPVTSVLVKSIKGKDELVNLSPDFFAIESVVPAFDQLDYININYHSFSVYLNRLVRENHVGQAANNLRFALVERTLEKLARRFGMRTYRSDTLLSRSLVSWLEFIDQNRLSTHFIGA